MTKEEAYKHEWHDGEKIWAVMHKYLSIPEQFSFGAMPVEVKEITVKNADRNTYCNTTFLKIRFDIDDKKYTCWDDYLGIDYNHDLCRLSYNTDRLCCDSKFFDKESAEKEFVRQVKDFSKHLENCKKEIDSGIKENISEIKRLERENKRLTAGADKVTLQIKDYKETWKEIL